MSTQTNTDDLLSAVESFFAELPAKRRGRRTRAEIDAPIDDTPEAENYDTPSLFDTLCGGSSIKRAEDDPARALLLSWEIQGRFAMVYRLAMQRPEAKAANAALPDLVKQLAEMAGSNESEEVQDRAAAMFHTLEWERQQPILLATIGRYFATEADWMRYKATKGGVK